MVASFEIRWGTDGRCRCASVIKLSESEKLMLSIYLCVLFDHQSSSSRLHRSSVVGLESVITISRDRYDPSIPLPCPLSPSTAATPRVRFRAAREEPPSVARPLLDSRQEGRRPRYHRPIANPSQVRIENLPSISPIRRSPPRLPPSPLAPSPGSSPGADLPAAEIGGWRARGTADRNPGGSKICLRGKGGRVGESSICRSSRFLTSSFTSFRFWSSYVHACHSDWFLFQWWRRRCPFVLILLNGADSFRRRCISMYGWSHGAGGASYIQAPLELHRAYLSALHCPHHLHGSGMLFVSLVPIIIAVVVADT